MDDFFHSYDIKTHRLSCTLSVSRFDAPVVPAFKKSLESAWKTGVRLVVLDLASVDFIDSSGIGALLALQKRLPEDAEPLNLINVKGSVADVIELLRLHRVFNLHTDPT